MKINLLFKANNKGMSILNVLIALAIGSVVIVGITKVLIQVSEKNTEFKHKRDLLHTKTSIMKNIKNTKAWWATVQRSTAPCFPGARNGGVECPIHYWHNITNPDGRETYNIDTGSGGSLKQWVCPYSDGAGAGGGNSMGTGLAYLNGRPIYPEDIAGGLACCAANAPGSTLESCLLAADPSLTNKYVVIEVHPPAFPMVDSRGLPPFQVNIQDVSAFGKRSEEIVNIPARQDIGTTPVYTGVLADPTCGQECAVAVGSWTTACGLCSISLGAYAFATENNSIAIGTVADTSPFPAAVSANRVQLGGRLGTDGADPVIPPAVIDPLDPHPGNAYYNEHYVVVGVPTSVGIWPGAVYAEEAHIGTIYALDTTPRDELFRSYFTGEKKSKNFSIKGMSEHIEKYRSHPALTAKRKFKNSTSARVSELWKGFEYHAIYLKELSDDLSETEAIYINSKQIIEQNLSSVQREHEQLKQDFKEVNKYLYGLEIESLQLESILSKLEKDVKELSRGQE